ncbi:MAG: flagellar biosynthetic protein FliQ, partial [Pseudomonadota bacterium]
MDAEILRLTQQALLLILILSAPPIIVASIIGLFV